MWIWSQDISYVKYAQFSFSSLLDVFVLVRIVCILFLSKICFLLLYIYLFHLQFFKDTAKYFTVRSPYYGILQFFTDAVCPISGRRRRPKCISHITDIYRISQHKSVFTDIFHITPPLICSLNLYYGHFNLTNLFSPDKFINYQFVQIIWKKYEKNLQNSLFHFAAANGDTAGINIMHTIIFNFDSITISVNSFLLNWLTIRSLYYLSAFHLFAYKIARGGSGSGTSTGTAAVAAANISNIPTSFYSS